MLAEQDAATTAALAQLLPGLEFVARRALGDRDDARDAAQETMLRVIALLRGKGLPAGYTLDKFAFGVLRHVILDAHSSRKKKFSLPRLLPTSEPTALDQLITGERFGELDRALARLDRADRELIERCYWRDQTVAQIARATGERADRIRKRKSRALERLRALLRRDPRHTSDQSGDL